MKILLVSNHDQESWGDKSHCLPHIAYLRSQGHEVNLHTAEWFGSEQWTRSEQVGITFFTHLVVPTFNIGYGDSYLGDELFRETYNAIYYAENGPGELKDIHYYWKTKEVKKFRYKINPVLIDENYLKIKKELSQTNNVVIYPPYGGYGGWPNGVVSEHTFPKMLNSIIAFDSFCKRNPNYRIILANKRAAAVHYHLTSDYFDLRNFEKLNLSMPQAFHLIFDNCAVTFGSASSFSTWITPVDNVRHILYLHDHVIDTNLNHYTGLPYYSLSNQEITDPGDVFLGEEKEMYLYKDDEGYYRPNAST